MDMDPPSLLSRIQGSPEVQIKPTLLERLTEPTLLQRMNVSESSENLKKLWNHSEEKESRKQVRSPPSEESLKEAITSSSPNHKKIRLSTPTLQKFSPFNPPLTKPVTLLVTKGHKMSYHQQLEEYPHNTLGRSENLILQIVTPKTTGVPSVRNSPNPICPGLSNLLNPTLELAMPAAKKPASFY